MADDDRPISMDAPAEPLFVLELGANGGTFAPKTLEEAKAWIEHEFQFWQFLTQSPQGYKDLVVQLVSPINSSRKVLGRLQPDAADTKERIVEVGRLLARAYSETGLLHSSSTLGRQLASLKAESPQAAIAFAWAVTRNPEPHNFPFGPESAEAHRGLIAGLQARFNVLDSDRHVAAHAQALEDLRERHEKPLGERRLAMEELHRNYLDLKASLETATQAQAKEFSATVEAADAAMKQHIEEHKKSMEAIAETFREKMTLRAPVEYWEKRGEHHTGQSAYWLKWTFGSMVLLAAVLAGLGLWALRGDKPDPWATAVAVLIGVVGVWAVRLVVRLYLSHQHLATDAAERVTMVQTYLSLLEGQKMPSDEDRKLVLGPLFRPAADGIVKDEGLPHPVLDLFTRPRG